MCVCVCLYEVIRANFPHYSKSNVYKHGPNNMTTEQGGCPINWNSFDEDAFWVNFNKKSAPGNNKHDAV